jgi:hypothetical protein
MTASIYMAAFVAGIACSLASLFGTANLCVYFPGTNRLSAFVPHALDRKGDALDIETTGEAAEVDPRTKS